MGRAGEWRSDMWEYERAAAGRGCGVIAGVDEVGRGPLAGPVVAAAVVLPFECDLAVKDSKALTPRQRDRAFDRIQECALGIGVASLDSEQIDSLNILKASQQAMRDAVAALPLKPDLALLDGMPVYPFPVPHQAIVKGDSLSASIAAASIIAKVTRDRMMVEMDARYPGYGFAGHKGYCAPEHLAALRELGPCPIHRRSFAPVAELVGLPGLDLPSERRRTTGCEGEEVAASYLRGHGYEVLATRFHCQGGELDVVARQGDCLVFAEVKARHGSKTTNPAEAVDLRKRSRIAVAARAYLTQNPGFTGECRFDVIEVVFGRDGMARVNHIPAAFIAGE